MTKQVDQVVNKVKQWKKRIDAARPLLAKALEDLDDYDVMFLLDGALFYGWKQLNGEWRNGPRSLPPNPRETSK